MLSFVRHLFDRNATPKLRSGTAIVARDNELVKEFIWYRFSAFIIDDCGGAFAIGFHSRHDKDLVSENDGSCRSFAGQIDFPSDIFFLIPYGRGFRIHAGESIGGRAAPLHPVFGGR